MSAPGFTRKTEIVAGSDCMYAPCLHTPRGEHGIRGERIFHTLTTEVGGLAVVIEVSISTDQFPPTVPASVPRDAPRMRGLIIHQEDPTSKQACHWLAQQPCKIVYDSALAADVLQPYVADRHERQSDANLERAREPGTLFWSRFHEMALAAIRDPTLFAQPDETPTMRDVRARHAQAEAALLAAQSKMADAMDEIRHAIGKYSARDPGYRR